MHKYLPILQFYSFCSLCVYGATIALIPYLALVNPQLFTPTVLATVMAARVLSQRIPGVFSGWVSDRYGPEATHLVGLSIRLSGLVVLSGHPSVESVTIGMALFGLGAAFFGPAYSVILSEVSQNGAVRDKNFRRNAILEVLGSVIGTLVGAFLIYINPQKAMLCVALFYTLVSVFATWGIRQHFKVVRVSPSATSPAVINQVVAGGGNGVGERLAWFPIVALGAVSMMPIFVVNAFLHVLASVCIPQLINSEIVVFSYVLVGLLYVCGAQIVAGRPAGEELSERFMFRKKSLQKYMLWCLVFSLASLIFSLFVRIESFPLVSIVLVVLAVVLFAPVLGMSEPFLKLSAIDTSEARGLGKGNCVSWYNAISGTLTSLSIWVLSLAFEWRGVSALMGVAGLLCVFALILVRLHRGVGRHELHREVNPLV